VSTQHRRPTAEQFAVLDSVIRHVARAGRLLPDDADEFSQSVHVKLLERRYDVFDRFDGRSSLRTYLTVVVRRMLLDWRNAAQGKWRTSAAALKLGDAAVALERLIYRDAFQASEAIRVLRSGGCGETTVRLHELWEQLPKRQKRRRVPDETLDEHRAAAFEDPLEAEQRRRRRLEVESTVARLLRQLPAEDRWLLRTRYKGAQSIRSMAQALDVEPRQLYRRCNRVLRTLRRSLESAGLTDPRIH
jgi:RNA polymerase sigma factor (sigma-70 family)